MLENITVPSTCRDPFVVWQDLNENQWYWYLDIPFSDDHGPFETSEAAMADVQSADTDVEIGTAENNYRNWSPEHV